MRNAALYMLPCTRMLCVPVFRNALHPDETRFKITKWSVLLKQDSKITEICKQKPVCFAQETPK